ncbi:Protein MICRORCHIDIA 7 [Vitis vinifera]|uniref:Protein MICRORCHIDIA 7 n=1 Tax=Vitis vinifera TaxID=29760 RepID=A0A438EXX7_VITVI|nr:Protein MICRORCHIDIA 7 [Vitis vinifera]
MRRFAQIIDELGLVDIPLQGKAASSNIRSLPDSVRGGRVRRGPSPFKFENMWLKAEGFQELIKGWWQGIEVSGRPSYRLATKLKGLKQNLKTWNKEVFGRGGAKSKKEAKESYEKWVSMEEVHWRQVSRELWLREGDRNTGFFHRMANAHRRINVMSKIMINGVSFTKDQDMREGIANAYQQLLSENPGWKADIGGLLMNQISPSEADGIEVPFSETEIFTALKGMNGDKAPGPDGFTLAFWQNSWETVKEDLLGLFKEFHDQNSFIKSLNHTFLVLANRIKKVIGKVISPDQNAFIKGRQILDGSLIANEVIDLWQKRGEKGIVCKLDIEKAYDSINWQFLLKVMQKMGFGSKWIGWMWYCISTVKYSVLVNGAPTGFFSSTKGLRQGDPLSPYLFIMGMEVLSVLITRAAEGGFIKGCRIWRDREQAVKVTHLLFADDTIIFCEAKKEALLHLGWVLFWFEAASGLKINLDKSMVIPVGEVDGVLDMAAEIGCRVGQLPTVYLGLPLGAPNRDVSAWDGVEERTRRRLSLWKRQYLSKGGRLTLIKSTLSSFPLYQMSVFRMPKSVARRIEKLQRDFLWGGTNGGTKSHLVKWEAVCVEKEKGGLGLRKITILNKALLGKWIWRFACAKEEFWKKVLEAKYGKEEFGWRTRKANGAFGVGVWKEILKESTWCWENMGFKVGKGSRIRNVTVEECWDQNTGQGGWILGLLRDLNDWEVGLVGNILAVLRDYSVTMEDDAVCWKKGEDGLFKIKYAYNVLANSHGLDFPHSNVWWVFPNSVKEVLSSWKGSFVGRKRKEVWKAIPWLGSCQGSPKFLHSNATSHKWALGAFAELLDNSLDEICNGATYVNVDMLENKKDGNRMLLIEDGNGFKTSTMRLGADVIVFSRCCGKDGKSPTQSIGLLSYTFLRSTGKEDIVVPMVIMHISISLDMTHLLLAVYNGGIGPSWAQGASASACAGFSLAKLMREKELDLTYLGLVWKIQVEHLKSGELFSSSLRMTIQFYKRTWYTYNHIQPLGDDPGQLELDFDTDPKVRYSIRGVNRDEKNIQMAKQFQTPGTFDLPTFIKQRKEGIFLVLSEVMNALRDVSGVSAGYDTSPNTAPIE